MNYTELILGLLIAIIAYFLKDLHSEIKSFNHKFILGKEFDGFRDETKSKWSRASKELENLGYRINDLEKKEAEDTTRDDMQGQVLQSELRVLKNDLNHIKRNFESKLYDTRKALNELIRYVNSYGKFERGFELREKATYAGEEENDDNFIA